MQALSARRSVNVQLRLPLPLDLHAISVPARQFTGDFHFSHRRRDAVWLAVGDVAGKGLNAAVVMAMIQEELERRIASCAETACDYHPLPTDKPLGEALAYYLQRRAARLKQT